MERDIYKSCSSCVDGFETVTRVVDGEPVTEEIECRACGGSDERMSSLHLSDDLIDLLKDMKDKINDIFEKVNE